MPAPEEPTTLMQPATATATRSHLIDAKTVARSGLHHDQTTLRLRETTGAARDERVVRELSDNARGRLRRRTCALCARVLTRSRERLLFLLLEHVRAVAQCTEARL